MEPQIEVWDRQTNLCPDCGGERVVYNGAAVAEGVAVAMFWAFLYDHPGNPEVFIDAAFGTWPDEADEAGDHVTFGSRTGEVEEHPHIASTLVTGAVFSADDSIFGVKLTREQALTHPLLGEFWQVNDAILGIDEIQRLLSGRTRRRRWSWRR